MYHVPMCVVCGEQEVGSQIASPDFCSGECLEEARTFFREVEEDSEQDYLDGYDAEEIY